tara:strand:- start:967 stop:1731 length:765 start_codon:yes stop_codon:yes gene_type:complete
MNRHLSLRSGNPALTKNTFSNFSISTDQAMTLEGTVNKTMISLLLLMISAGYTWNTWSPESGSTLMYVGMFGGFILALVTIFKPVWAPITVPIYAILKGLALGIISKIYNDYIGYPGIVEQAIFLTFGILGCLLFAYKTKLIKPTENFKLGLFAATGGIFLVYIGSFIYSIFTGQSFGVMNAQNGSLISIGFSMFVVVIASLNLVLDFDFIEEGAEKGAPKYMEWYGAFGLLVTLIWLYLEILRLLSKINSRRN